MADDDDDGVAGDDEDTDGDYEMEDPSSDDEDAGDVDELLDEALDEETEEKNIHRNAKPPATKDSAAAASAETVSDSFNCVKKVNKSIYTWRRKKQQTVISNASQSRGLMPSLRSAI